MPCRPDIVGEMVAAAQVLHPDRPVRSTSLLGTSAGDGAIPAIQSHRSVAGCLEELRDLDLVMTFADESFATAITEGTRQRTPGIE